MVILFIEEENNNNNIWHRLSLARVELKIGPCLCIEWE
jgi:hypothetical protein